MKPASPARDAPPQRPESPRLSPRELRRLSRRSNWRSLGIVAATLGGIGLVFAAAMGWPTVWCWALGFACIAALQHHLTIIQHEANHYLLFTNRRANEFVLALVAYSVGFTRSYRHIHLRHHHSLGQDDDPDLHNYAQYPNRLGVLLRDVFNSLTGLGAARQFLAQAALGNKAGLPDERSRAARRPRTSFDFELLGVAAVQAVILAALGLAGAWHLYFLLWLAPLATLTKTLAHLRNVVEHTMTSAAPAGEFARHRTVLCGPLEQFFLAPLYFNYHAEHHLYPSIPYFNLPTAHRLLRRQEAYRQAVHVQRGYLRFLIRHVVLRGLPATTRPEERATEFQAADGPITDARNNRPRHAA